MGLSWLSRPSLLFPIFLFLFRLLVLILTLPHNTHCISLFGKARTASQPSRSQRADLVFEQWAWVQENWTAPATLPYGIWASPIKIGDRPAPTNGSLSQLNFEIIDVKPPLQDYFKIERYDNDPSMAIVSVTKHLDRERLEKEYPEQVEQVAILSGTGPFDKHKGQHVEILLTIEVTDPSDISAGATKVRLIVSVVDSNEKPNIELKRMKINLMENSDLTIVNPLIQVSAIDEDEEENSEVNFSLGEVRMFNVDGSSPLVSAENWFRIDGKSGEVSILKVIDRERVEKFTIVVIATDQGEKQLKDTATITLCIQDVNENPTICEETLLCNVTENYSINTLLNDCKFSCTDADVSKAVIQYSIKSLVGSTCPFTVNENGQISTGTVQLDRERISRYECRVEMADSIFSRESKLTIQVLDLNDNAPRLNKTFVTIQNIVNETISIEFVDDDEDDGDFVVELKNGSQYFEIVDNLSSSNASLRRRVSRSQPFYALKLKRVLPADLRQLDFVTEDAAGNVGEPSLRVNFPQTKTTDKPIVDPFPSDPFPLSSILIIICIVLLLLVLIILTVRICYRRYKPTRTPTPTTTCPPTPESADPNIVVVLVENEEPYLRRCFNYFETYKNGHFTSSKFLEALQWMNVNPCCAEREQRVVTNAYVDHLMNEYHIDNDQTLNFEEFTWFMRCEMFQNFKNNTSHTITLSKSQVLEFLKKAGFFHMTWNWFLNIFDQNLIDNNEFISMLWAHLLLTIPPSPLSPVTCPLSPVDKFHITEAERDYYWKIFNDHDRNQDGNIENSELQALFKAFDDKPFHGRAKRNATAAQCESLIVSADTDRNGTLSFEEFLRLMVAEKKLFLMKAFNAADIGGKGFLREQEVMTALASAGYDINFSARKIVADAIGGEDGKINYNEFIKNL